MSQKPAKKILFVDDDESFLTMVQRSVRHHSEDQWEVLTANSASRGLALVQEQKVDLVAIDLHMPVVDGMQLLALLHRKYPNIVKVILTGDTSTAQRSAALETGAELFLEKPTSREGWKNVFDTLSQLTALQQTEGFHGVMRQVSLPDVLQLSCLSKQSIVLRIRAAETEGFIYVKDGNIIHAKCGQERGENAFNLLMTLAGGEFELQPFATPDEETINQSWEFLVMEAARKRDELAQPSPTGNTELLFKQIAISDTTRLEAAARERQAAQKAEAALQPRVDEIMVCSLEGEVLHEWQCPSTAGRVSFMQLLTQKARELARILPLGEFDRLEINGHNARVIAQFQPERTVLVRTSRVPIPPAPTATR